MRFTISMSDVADETVRSAIGERLGAYNIQQTGVDDRRPLVVTLGDDDGQIVGGLWGRTVWQWLYVELLFVPEPLRRQGIGTDMLQRAEVEAVKRGCRNAWLDTFAFQARGFYERLGYSCFGELTDYPPGFSRYFMKKALA